MPRSLLAAISVLLWLSLSPGGLLAAQLAKDYAQFEGTRRSLETQRGSYESEQQKNLERLNQRKAAWNDCVERIKYPERVCWEQPRIEAAGREQTLQQQRRALETVRRELEGERMNLESARKDIEARFSNKNPGSAYETHFRRYMQDLSVYVGRVRDELLAQQYEGYLASVKDYVEFVNEQANACPAPTPCELAQRYQELDAKQIRVRKKRLAFEQELSSAAAMFSAATDLWTNRSQDAKVMLAIEGRRQAIEEQRSGLEQQRRELEKLRAELEGERVNLERRREDLEQSGGRRGSAYQAEFIAAYVEPMSAKLENENRLFDYYQSYRNAILLYVYFVRDAVGESADMQSDVALVSFDREYAAEMEEIKKLIESTSAGDMGVATVSARETSAPTTEAASAPTEVAGVANAAFSEESAKEPQEEKKRAAGIVVVLFTNYVESLRIGLIRFSGGSE